MSNEEKEKDIYEKMAQLEEVFRNLFKDALHVETKKVKVGGTSSNIYVSKRFGGHPVTLIIWDKEQNPQIEHVEAAPVVEKIKQEATKEEPGFKNASEVWG
jgi:hypothetical protein